MKIKALDEVRAGESRKMAQEGYPPLLKKSRWCGLKRKQNLTSQQKFRLRDLLRYNLQTVRAYLLKDFQQFWEYTSPTCAGMFLDFCCYQTMIPYRAEEENHPHLARSPYCAAQLFQGQEAVFQRRDRGAQQQGQSDPEKILWFSHLPHPATSALSLTWQTAPAWSLPMSSSDES